MTGVKFNEIPVFKAEDPDEKTHAIIVSDLMNPNQPLIIPLVLKVVTNPFLSSNTRASEY